MEHGWFHVPKDANELRHAHKITGRFHAWDRSIGNAELLGSSEQLGEAIVRMMQQHGTPSPAIEARKELQDDLLRPPERTPIDEVGEGRHGVVSSPGCDDARNGLLDRRAPTASS